MKKFILCSLLFAFCPFGAHAEAGAFDIDRWYMILHDIQNRAIEMKISNHTINSVIQPSNFIPAVLQNDKNQSEFKLSLEQYLSRMVNEARIANGKKMRAKYPTLLSKIDKKYGIPPHVIMAFWGLESNYGEFKARYKLSDAFLTLIYDGRREAFFTSQLFSLMKTADKNNIEISEIRGSWAGAMGHFQFIPTSLEQYGADGNNDGKVDITNSIGDAMFSAGNYLAKLGWNKNEKIVRKVKLPVGFDESLCDGRTKKTLGEWRALGLTGVPNANMTAGLVCDAAALRQAAEQRAQDNSNLELSSSGAAPFPALGPANLAYLTYPNFYRIKKWNNSNWYATAIALLAEELK
ncbi:MAG: lytic murein transglycosylase [Rickettsiales bacterium]|jgi:membrane-bound lytic murein transglycosylase B|nr:lytic murein transglycosylase [Rickettsiales bacterium]